MEILDKLMESENFFEMANIKGRESGLHYDVWLDSLGSRRNIPHNTPRIKVDVDGELIPVIFSPDKIESLKDFKHKSEILAWVRDNYETLTKHWNGELSDYEAISQLIKKSK